MPEHLGCNCYRRAGPKQLGGSMMPQIMHMQIGSPDRLGEFRPLAPIAHNLSGDARAFEQQFVVLQLGPDAPDEVGRVGTEEQHARIAGLGGVGHDRSFVEIHVQPAAFHDFAAARAGFDEQADQGAETPIGKPLGAFQQSRDVLVADGDAAQGFFVAGQAQRWRDEALGRQVAADGPLVERADGAGVTVDGGGRVEATLHHGFGSQGELSGGEGPGGLIAEAIDPLAQPQVGAVELHGAVRFRQFGEGHFGGDVFLNMRDRRAQIDAS